MGAPSATRTSRDPRVVINVGSGREGHSSLPRLFETWRCVRIDIDPDVTPDIIGDATDLSAVESGSVDAVWTSHCIEHLYVHEVPRALAEFHRVLKPSGFACILVPDLQRVAQFVASDNLDDVLYQSPAGPVTPHDILYGFGPALASGITSMAHKCGFTPTVLGNCFRRSPFPEAIVLRRPAYELMAIGCKTAPADQLAREALVSALQA